MARLLHLIRHGAINPAGEQQFIGSTDLPLSDEGRDQVRGLADLIAPLKPECCWVSPLRRARETAEVVFPGMPLQVVEELREIDFGRWEQRTFSQIAASDPDLVQQWYEFDASFAFPEGESLHAFHERMTAIAQALVAAPPERIALVTHGGVIRSLICRFLGLGLRDYLLFDVALASLTTIEVFGDKGVLRCLSVMARSPSPVP